MTLDLVGQMDTAFRLLDPISFLSSRESVPIRAFVTQTTERDFYGRPIDQVGPGGVYSRTANLLNDMFAPIGIGQAALQVGLERGHIPSGMVPVSERGLGTRGQMVQATGVNLRAQYLSQEWRGDFDAYNAIPTESSQLQPGQPSRLQYRKRNPEIEAKLFITGDVSSLSSPAAINAAARLSRANKIDPNAIKGIQDRRKERAAATKPVKWNEVDALLALLGAARAEPSAGGAPTPRGQTPVVPPGGQADSNSFMQRAREKAVAR